MEPFLTHNDIFGILLIMFNEEFFQFADEFALPAFGWRTVVISNYDYH